MPRKPCYWTRKLELDLVEFVRKRDCIWRPMGNTNHHIQQKYKAYAEFAAKLGRGFTGYASLRRERRVLQTKKSKRTTIDLTLQTIHPLFIARSVRDRWVNIRSTFNQNLRRLDKSKQTAQTSAEVYTPCWPLWKPLQFLRTASRKEDFKTYPSLSAEYKDFSNLQLKEESHSDVDNTTLTLRQRGQRTDRPRRQKSAKTRNNQCRNVIDDLVNAMKPLTENYPNEKDQRYWFFGKHVTESLNAMREEDADLARQDILRVLNEIDTGFNNQNVDMT